MGGNAAFLDLVYDAAVEPSGWAPALERFADMIGGFSVTMIEQNQATGEGRSFQTVRVDPAAHAAYFGYYATRNVLLKVSDPRAFMKSWTPRILTDEDWIAKEDLLRSEYFNDYLKPRNIHSVLMVRLASRDLFAATINVGRAASKGQYTAREIDVARRAHPHLIRAFELGRKIAAAHDLKADLAEALDRSSCGVFVIGEDGLIRHTNSAAEDLLRGRRGLSAASGALRAAKPDEERRLQSMIAAASVRDPGLRTGGSMTIADPARQRPLSLTVTPLRSERYSAFFSGTGALVSVADPERGDDVPEQRLCDLFGLTRAEARVARQLLEGRSPKETAASLDLSFNTVRAHLARIFDKTGTRRQAELVRLIMRSVGH